MEKTLDYYLVSSQGLFYPRIGRNENIDEILKKGEKILYNTEGERFRLICLLS